MSSTVFTYQDLQIAFQTQFNYAWRDKGSGADRDGSFFNPKPMNGFYSIGSIAIPGYPGWDSQGQVANAVAIMVKDLSGKALKPPTDYQYVYSDRGSGADDDGSFWRPVPPAGYVALGHVCVAGYNKPSTGMIRCVRQDLVVNALVNGTYWDDKGSGAKDDVVIHKVDAPDAPSGEIYLVGATFLARGGADRWTPELNLAFALRFTVSEVQATTTLNRPVLTSRDRPSPWGTETTTSTTTLPWYAVKDTSLNAAQKAVKSPTYQLVRTDKYMLLEYMDNASSVPQSTTKSYTAGYSQSETKTFSETTAIEFSSTFKFTDFFSAGIKLTQSFTFSSSTTNTQNYSETISYPLVAPANSAVAAWVIHSSFVLYRQDGSMVAGGVTANMPNSVYVAQFPK